MGDAQEGQGGGNGKNGPNKREGGGGLNLLNQREKLKEAHRKGAIDAKTLHASLHSPVFIWNQPKGFKYNDQEVQWINENLIRQDTLLPKVAPFDCFRISSEDGFYQWSFCAKDKAWFCFAVFYKMDLEIAEEGVKRIQNEFRKCGLEKGEAEIPRLVRNAPEMWMEVEGDENGHGACVWEDGREIREIDMPEAFKLGMSDPSEQQILRAAHWRRAHFRRLVSDRYKNKGSLIPVSQAWVGPKEWVGLDKKTYKVIELRKDSAA
jgi:hypothetical protein